MFDKGSCYYMKIVMGRPGLVVPRVSCNRGLADKTANANNPAIRQHVHQYI